MTSRVSFEQLNHGWNAEPNAPDPTVKQSGPDLLLRFAVNPFRFKEFNEEDVGVLRFYNCARYRLGPTNDEGWYRGKCRYSGSAPAWGEFYELSGDDPHLDEPHDWVIINRGSNPLRHFLFYLRDDTFECIASDWSFDPEPTNALYRVLGPLPRS
jgi:hypothetical protein